MKKYNLLILFFLYTVVAFPQKDSVSKKPQHIIKFNPCLLLSGEVAFAYEYKVKNKAAELELGYIFPWTWNPISDFTIQMWDDYPALYYNGISANLFLKYYASKRFYLGVSAICKYMYFNNKTILYYYDGPYPNINCSQIKNVYGLAFRCGFLFYRRKIIFEPYCGIGLRMIKTKTNYHYYYYSNSHIYNGEPTDEGIDMDNGTFWYPYLNIGFKIGLRWKPKASH